MIPNTNKKLKMAKSSEVILSTTSEEEGPNPKRVLVKVKGCDSNKKHPDFRFRIETDTPLRWLMVRYCDKVVLLSSTRFMFKGVRLRETDTPLQLSMIHHDAIHVFDSPVKGDHRHSAVHYVTLCVRMHKEKDSFVRVTRTAPILHQLMRCTSDGGAHAQGSLCFVYDVLKLTDSHTADELDMEDGDIIDAFDFDDCTSSLNLVDQRLAIKVRIQCYKAYVFIMRPSTPISRLNDRIRELEGYHDFVLLHEARWLQASKTLAEEGLRDGDELDVILRLRGG